jgi:hypothetical protein
MRKIADEDLKELEQIFRVTGGTALSEKIEACSRMKALELGIINGRGEPDMEKYYDYVNNEPEDYEQ